MEGEERRRCKVMINYSIRILCYIFLVGVVFQSFMFKYITI